MIFWKIFLILPWLLFDPLSAAGQISVHFKANAAVAGPRIVLADIAEITPASPEANEIGHLPVGSAPAPGKSKELSTVTVINSLRNRAEAADVDWQGSPTIVVERPSTIMSQEQLRQIIAAYLSENSTKLPSAEVRFTSIRAPKTLTLPAGELSWKVTPSRPGIMGSSSFSIALFVDGKPAGTCVVRGRLEVVAEVVTAAATLHKGDFITKANIVLQRQDIGGIDNPIMASEEILGKQAARTVNAGTILERKHIVLPPVVKEGELLKILAHKGALHIATSGIARSDGRMGENIPVKNISSN